MRAFLRENSGADTVHLDGTIPAYADLASNPLISKLVGNYTFRGVKNGRITEIHRGCFVEYPPFDQGNTYWTLEHFRHARSVKSSSCIVTVRRSSSEHSGISNGRQTYARLAL